MGVTHVGVVSRREMPCPTAPALRAVQDISAIEQTELKADRVTVHPEDGENGTYEVTGRFAGVPWRSRFRYRLFPTGFHSHKVPGERPRAWGISGGFAVAGLTDDRCVVMHYEDYEVPRYLAPLAPAIALYLRWSMREELRRLERLVVAEDRAASPAL